MVSRMTLFSQSFSWTTNLICFLPFRGFNNWAKEHVNYNYDQNSCAPGEDCGHYTQVKRSARYFACCQYVQDEIHSSFDQSQLCGKNNIIPAGRWFSGNSRIYGLVDLVNMFGYFALWMSNILMKRILTDIIRQALVGPTIRTLISPLAYIHFSFTWISDRIKPPVHKWW